MTPAQPVGAAPRRPAEPIRPEAARDVRKLIVGRDITLSGEIAACDHLIVEGTVEASVKECHRLEVAESGLFKGAVEINEAEIAGRFEGQLTVQGRLSVRSTGRIEGKIQAPSRARISRLPTHPCWISLLRTPRRPLKLLRSPLPRRRRAHRPSPWSCP
jgi:hypothetical protein